MNIVIRADSSAEIGTGHMMRCLAVAEELRRRGAMISFICRDLLGHLGNYAAQRGFTVRLLPASEADWKTDAQQTITILKRLGHVDCILVDHYGLDYRWETMVRTYAGKMIVIDDLANRRHDCDMLIDANLSDQPDRYSHLVPEHCRLLLGTSYAMLRNEFRQEKMKLQERTGEITRILIFFGGSDPTMETVKVLHVLNNERYRHLCIDVVVGISNSNKVEIAELCENTPNMTCSVQVENMAERMRKADLSIGAGGSATWERCYLRLPALVIVTADNQLELTKLVSEAGAVRFLGESSQVTEGMIETALNQLLRNSAQVKEMTEKTKSVMGEDRFSELIEEMMEG